MNIRDFLSVSARRNALEKERNISLHHTGTYSLDESVAAAKNCENMIGVTQVPLGIAGPVNGEYIPLSTTEGALVASVNRGCKAITESGGAHLSAFRMGASRGVVFYTGGISRGAQAASEIYALTQELKSVAAGTSGHISLMEIVVKTVGTYAFVRFSFDTKDAMGMNMVTVAATELARFIEEKTHLRSIAVAGNYDIDKKPSWLNIIRGRGFEVRADTIITKETLSQVLKTTAQSVYDVWLAKCMIGSALSGSMGFNAQVANIVAALFIATGQDPAHVTEASCAITTCEIRGSDVYISVYLPDVMVGTVGGGTGLATQNEALNILRVKTSQQFAEVVGAAVLAGEVSLLASLAEGSLAHAHKTLARGGK